jgi:hypothetical protein
MRGGFKQGELTCYRPVNRLCARIRLKARACMHACMSISARYTLKVAIPDDRPRRIKAVITLNSNRLVTKNKNHKVA